MTDYRVTTSEFIRKIHQHTTTGNIALQAILAGGRAPELVSRDPLKIDAWVEKMTRAGATSIYWAPCTVRPGAEPAGSIVRCRDNMHECASVHADVDPKHVMLGLDEIVAVLRGLPIGFGALVYSGHGVHPYWPLTEPWELPQYTERVEALLNRMAAVLGGDRLTVASNLRPPGTRNRKVAGEDLLVTYEGTFRRYDLGDLEEFFFESRVLIARRGGPEAGGEAEDEFLRHARLTGFRPTVDVQAALAGMRYGNLHESCLSIAGKLMRDGVAPEAIADQLVPEIGIKLREARRVFNPARERRNVLAICRWIERQEARSGDRERREPPGERHESREQATGTGGGATIHSFGDEKAKRQPKGKDEKPDLIALVGKSVLDTLGSRGERVVFGDRGHWTLAPDGMWRRSVTGTAAIDAAIHQACKAMRLAVDNRFVGNVLGWIRRETFHAPEPAFDQHGMVPTRSGLVDPDTLELRPLRPEDYATWRVEAPFERGAECPLFLELLRTCLSDRADENRDLLVQVIGEHLGAGMIDAKPRALCKALALIGDTFTGKSQVLHVLSGMFTDDPIVNKFETLNTSHGTMPFLKRAPWTLHEAFNAATWHLSDTVKTIITQEPFQINIKGGQIVTQRFYAPAFWGTNHPPQFKETTQAIVNRITPIYFNVKFSDLSPVGVALKAREAGCDGPADLILKTERAGILQWALEGLRAARARGYITPVHEVSAVREKIHQESNLVSEFIKDCIEFDPNNRLKIADFCLAHGVWWAENHLNRTMPSNKQVGHAVNALYDPRVAKHRDNVTRYYLGIALNAQGVRFHTKGHDHTACEDKRASATMKDGIVNTDIPSEWMGLEPVVRMRAAHGATVTSPVTISSEAGDNVPF